MSSSSNDTRGRTARLFAARCARAALGVVKHPDPRSVRACCMAERFANGETTRRQLDQAQAEAWDATLDGETHVGWDADQVASKAAARAAAMATVHDLSWDMAMAVLRETVRAMTWAGEGK